jgi:hypothetical protein
LSNNQDYYHIVTRGAFEVGQRLAFSGSTNNKLFDFFFKKEFRSASGNDAYQIIRNGISDGRLSLGKEETDLLQKYNDITIRGIRELIVEMVRLQRYTNYPSRLNCLFVSRTYEDIERWKKIFESYNRKIVQIIKIKSNGSSFEGDGDLLPKEDATSFESKIIQANEYWESRGNSKLPEVLVDGDIEVVEIISDFRNSNMCDLTPIST